ncbi:putative udp-n-acetylmuramate--l-alanine ligase [Phaeomoniella chlamydospora]|uniref:Putative udp-n-acetylmuramate--l-alanine ligase n=1 Tax=Phaeomoniella chlamydospora TaxID=158046 RepID=A0A0G2E9F8_PHACM|nr:putative udp-n-acetylmuramate--l-alanine ligase [Phaeomoniella chlamydospora]
MGGKNYHIEIVFEDGVRWLARIRRFTASSPPPKLRDYLIQSEIATLKCLEATAVPTPKLFDYTFEGDGNPVGVGYMLIEKLPGTSLQWHVASSKQKFKVLEGLADAFIELQKQPLSEIGCLKNPSSHQIGPFARDVLTDLTHPI